MTDLHVAYVLLRFPSLTETFVAEEIKSLQQKGIHIHIYALLPAKDKIIQPTSRQLLSQAASAPDLYHPALLLAQVYFLFKCPATYLRLLATILKPSAPHLSFLLKRMVIFFKGVWLARQLEHSPVQLVHTHFAWLSALAGVVTGQLLDLPFTVTAHAYDIYSKKNDLLRLASHYADRIVTISDINKRVICQMSPGLRPESVEVIRCGLDLDRFHPVPKTTSGKTLRITSVGSLIGKKGHEYLIRASARLQAHDLDFECVIVGCGDLESSLQTLIHELGLQNRVHLVGAQTQEWVFNRLCNSDLFVLACVSDDGGGQDGIPVALMEAMAMTIPVISTSVSGIPELVRHEETGLLVPERNDEALAAAICRLSHDSLLCQSLIRNGLDLIRREYDIVQNTSKLSALFEGVIGEKQP